MPSAIYSPGDFSSQARFLFERFTNSIDGLVQIRTLVGRQPKAVETNHLEFKTGLVREEDIKPIWSKALGAFANSGGGVIIWGLRADRDGTGGIDAIQEEVPVPDVEKLAAKLRDLQPPATDPPIKGVQIHPMLIPGGKTGFVVCFIPESDAKPHRSEFGKSDVKRFNLRIGDSTQECSVPILRQLFYPKAAPKLEITLRALEASQSKGAAARQLAGLSVHLVQFTLRNTGPISLYEAVYKPNFGGISIYPDVQNMYTNPVFEEELGKSLHPHQQHQQNLVVFHHLGQTPDWEFTIYGKDILPRYARITRTQLFANYDNVVTVSAEELFDGALAL